MRTRLLGPLHPRNRNCIFPTRVDSELDWMAGAGERAARELGTHRVDYYKSRDHILTMFIKGANPLFGKQVPKRKGLDSNGISHGCIAN